MSLSVVSGGLSRGLTQPRRSAHVCSASTAGPNIAVVGAGVSGLTCAMRILDPEHGIPNAKVTVMANAFGCDTTSAGAAGLWGPYKLGKTPDDLVHKWGGDTYNHLMGLFYGPHAKRAGVSLVTTNWLNEEPTPVPVWGDIVHNFKELDDRQLKLLPSRFTSGFSGTSIACEGRFYLTWLTGALKAHGGRMVQCSKLGSLEDVGKHTPKGSASFDAIINCSGIAASDLVQDKEVYPIRGQVLRVRAPWINYAYIAGPDTYVIPNREFVVLGGTGQEGDYSLTASLSDRGGLLQRCIELFPSLEEAEVVEDWVGLRPGRNSVRLELEELTIEPVGGGSKLIPVIHNYGHGGAGLTLAWGCAGDVVDRLRVALS